MYSIFFPQKVGLAEMEIIISTRFRESLESEQVSFDLTQVRWLGHFPATMLYSWTYGLTRDRTRHVAIELPPRQELSSQVAKALLRFDILKQMSEIGVRVPYSAPSRNADGLPLTVVQSRSALESALSDGRRLLSEVTSFVGAEELTVEEAFSTVLFELGENAFLHSKGSRPHYQVSFATASGNVTTDEARTGVVSVFPAGTKYVEVVLGDLGSGIDRVLGSHVPNGYIPDFYGGRTLTRAEMAVAYAFEFSSSSNPRSRAGRIQDILGREHVDPFRIATGLYCVADLARRLGGQIIIRTPGALISFDFSSRHSSGPLRTRSDLLPGMSRVGLGRSKFPGTHYWLRLPLSPLYSVRDAEEAQQSLDISGGKVVAIPSLPWSVDNDQDNAEGHAIASAIERIDRAITARGKAHPDILVLLPALQRMSSRATAVFTAALHELARDCTVIWADPLVGQLYDPPQVLGRPASRVVLWGDLTTDTLYLSEAQHAASAHEMRPRPSIKLPEASFQRLVKVYLESLSEVLVEHLRSPAVRFSDGAFFLGRYYTDVFYDIRRALSTYRFAELTAKWVALSLVQHEAKLPNVILSSAPGVNPIAEELGPIIKQLTGESVHVITPHRNVTAAWIIGNLLPHQGKRLLIITDVICTGQTIETVVTAAAELGQLQVVSLVDAREPSRVNKPLFINALGASVPLMSLSNESIATHERPTAAYRADNESQSSAEEQRIYVIDRETRTAVLYAQPLRPAVTFTDFLRDILPASQSLISGHIDHNGRHYTHFLNLHRLFSFLRPQIEQWIGAQIESFLKTQVRSDEWHVRYLDSEASLTWLPECLHTLDSQPRTVERVSIADLDASGIPLREQGSPRNWVLIVPTVESGYSTRRFIEWASRHDAASILVLVLMSRMEPSEFAFLSRVTTYRERVGLRVWHFLEFELHSSVLGQRVCELCAAQSEFERLATIARERVGKESLITRAFIARADNLRATSSTRLLADEHYVPSASDVARAQLALLLHARPGYPAQPRIGKFREMTGSGEGEGVLLLQLISAEHPSPRARAHELLADPAVLDLAEHSAFELLHNAQPPLQLARVVPALCQLLQLEFLESAPSLLFRFANSLRDVEEILSALLILGTWPSGIDQVSQTLAESNETRESAQLITHARTIFEDLKQAVPFESNAAFVRACCDLQSELARSSALVAAMNLLDSKLESRSWEEIRQALDYVFEMWGRFGLELVTAMSTSERWDRLTKATTAGESLIAFRMAMADLLRCRSWSPVRDGSTALLSRVRESRRRVQVQAKELSKFLNSFFVSPVHLEIAQLSREELITYNGTPCDYVCEIDRTVGLAFMHEQALNHVCGEIIDNWKRNGGVEGRRGRAAFVLYQDNSEVILEFQDDFEGDFQEQSLGGLRTVERYCRNFASELERVPRNESGFKALRLRIQLLPKDARRDER